MTATTTDPARTFIDPDDPYQPSDDPEKIWLGDIAAVILTAACAVRLEGGGLGARDMQLAVDEGLKLTALLMQGLEEQDDEAPRVETIGVNKVYLIDLLNLTLEILTDIADRTSKDPNDTLRRRVSMWEEELSVLEKKMRGE